MTHTLTDTDEPRAWVGCLACYNAGRLVGAWVPGVEAGDYTPCTVPGHEEWWVLDHENYGGALTGECSPTEAQELAELIGTITEMGYDLEAVAAYAANEHGTITEDIVSRFEDAYRGEWDSLADYAQDLSESVGDPIPDRWPFYCIDWERAAHELEMGGDVWTARTSSGTVYVFGAE